MITKGTLGLGCHTSDIGCNTSYDNIKIKKYIHVLPTVSLGKFYVTLHTLLFSPLPNGAFQ